MTKSSSVSNKSQVNSVIFTTHIVKAFRSRIKDKDKDNFFKFFEIPLILKMFEKLKMF